MRRPVLVLLCTLLLAGCDWMRLPRGEASPLEHEDVLTRGSTDAVLVYGVTLRNTGTGPDAALGGEVTWLMERTDNSFPTIVSIALPSGLQPDRRVMMAWRVPAGTWSVRQVTWHDDSRSSGTQPASGRALATTVEPGHVTYAGDIDVDCAHQPPELTIVDDASTTPAALAGYPGVTATVEDHPLRDMRLAPEPGSRKRPTYTP